MDNVLKIFLEYGLLGAIVVAEAIVIYKLYIKLSTVQEQSLLSKDLEIQRKEKETEQYVNILEKALNGLNAIERTIFENNTNLSQKVLDSIKEAHKPLIAVIESTLKEKKQ